MYFQEAMMTCLLLVAKLSGYFRIPLFDLTSFWDMASLTDSFILKLSLTLDFMKATVSWLSPHLSGCSFLP
jgi:hypothetical protein